ncbi:MAG: class I SAM-dependent methyltransferase [bacterium]
MKLPKKYNIQKTNPEDPLNRYYQPFVKRIYIKRLQMALDCMLPATEKYNNILEIGYGSGIFFPELIQHCKKLYGLEIFGKDGKRKVEKMMQRENINAELITGSVVKMPFKENFFDVIFCISALEHLEPINLEKAISEIKRVTKKDGLIILGFPSNRKIMQLYCMLVTKNINFDFHRSDHNLILKTIGNNLKIETIKKFFNFLPIYYVVKCKK